LKAATTLAQNLSTRGQLSGDARAAVLRITRLSRAVLVLSDRGVLTPKLECSIIEQLHKNTHILLGEIPTERNPF